MTTLRTLRSLIRQDHWSRHVIQMLLTHGLTSSYAPPVLALLTAGLTLAAAR